MALSANFDIENAIRSIREIRSRFLVDTPAEAFAGSEVMVDRLWPLRAGQPDHSRFPLKLYQIDPNAPDQAEERRKRRDSALTAKLALPHWGYADNEGKDIDTLIDELERDLLLMARDGITPYERYVFGQTAPRFSDETRRYNESLLPKQREQMFETGLAIAPSRRKSVGRPRKSGETPNERLRRSGFVRGRENWRPDTIMAICKPLHKISQWISEQEPGDKLVATFVGRYRLAELAVSESKFAPSLEHELLACAIISARHLENGTDDYAADPAMSLPVTYYYGLYLRAIQQAGRSKRQTAPFLNKLLISNGYYGL